MELLSVENLCLLKQRMRRRWFHYDFEEKLLIDEVSFSIEKGRSLGLVGEEKSGKHALVLALMKLHPVASGNITFAEIDLNSLGERQFRRVRKRIQTVFSPGFGQLTPDLTLDQAFNEVLKLWYPKSGMDDWHQRAESVMVACGLPEAVRQLYPVELDAVERQQAALARALLSAPDLLICHGFTQGLDAVEQAELLNLLYKVREEFSLTLLVVTDDLAVAHHLGDNIGILHRGKLLEYGDAETVVNRPDHDYTKRLVSCSL